MDRIGQIGDFTFRLCCPEEIAPPENFRKFLKKEETGGGLSAAGSRAAAPDFTYRIKISDALPRPEGKVLARRSDLAVFQTKSGESRLIGVKGRERPYAYYEEAGEDCAEITLVREELRGLHIDPVFTSLFVLERRMICRDSLILHCAYMVYRGRAILFSAPSETGKSTQAGLWERYRGSRTVNGDRALLRKIGGVWNACGWPVCGTSEICHVEDAPVFAVVMLRQGKVNQAERLSPVQAFTQLYAQVTINPWNRDFVSRAMNGIEDLIGSVPVWQLTCDISEAAVVCLETALFPQDLNYS